MGIHRSGKSNLQLAPLRVLVGEPGRSFAGLGPARFGSGQDTLPDQHDDVPEFVVREYTVPIFLRAFSREGVVEVVGLYRYLVTVDDCEPVLPVFDFGFQEWTTAVAGRIEEMDVAVGAHLDRTVPHKRSGCALRIVPVDDRGLVNPAQVHKAAVLHIAPAEVLLVPGHEVPPSVVQLARCCKAGEKIIVD